MYAIYTRLSKEDVESNSIINQTREGKAFAKAKGFKNVKIYNEGEGISGASELTGRPVFKELLDDIDAGIIKMIWARDQKRIARNRAVYSYFLAAIIRQKVTLFLGNTEYDYEDADAKLHLGLLNEFSAYQVDKQSQQTKRALLDNVLEGKAHGKSTPLGYKADEKGYIVIDEEEKLIVEKIYQMCLEGNGSTTIKHYLNNTKVPTRYSKRDGTFKIKNRTTGKITHKKKSDVKWSDNQVQTILKNPMYKGKRRWNDIFVDCPAIFTDLYWEKVQQQYKLNGSSRNTGKNVDHKYLLKGLLECAQCESNYYGRTRVNKRDNYYMCSSKRYKDKTCTNRGINIDVLEKFVWELMYADNFFDKIIQTFKEGGTNKRREELKAKLKVHQTKIKGLDKEYKKTIELVIKGIVEESEILVSKKRIAKETLTLNELLERDKEEFKQLENENKTLNEFAMDWGILDEFEDLKKRAEITQRIKLAYRRLNFKPSFNEKKRILKKYIKRIYLSYEHEQRIYNIKLSFNLPIVDEVHLIDTNYIFKYDVKNKRIDELDFRSTNKFTENKKIETIDKMKNYHLKIKNIAL